ncbi:putative PKS/NRPS-like protein biosynthetic cluster [Purpureocillium lilacinum]|uniref:putative PKS/NRPS-like protein biosynthetic cluster n=1 Tax=Purpureocillium lilacinum TaxID=33203 RepID=UPI00207FDF00|nr:putative PKS/NRPS-like protein biosynthetic cluster [Purpureocillium lilacinum]
MLDSLPSYMVPQIFIRVPRIPVTVSGKTDRKRLRLIGESVAGEHLVKTQTNVSQSVQQPTSEVEKQLQSAWSRSLNVDVTDIGLHDSFLRLGGDSIAAMQASSLARSVSIDIGVEDILREKTISNLVNHISASTTNPNTDPQSDEPPVGTLSRFDIEFHVYRELEAFQLEVLFSTDLYEPGTISNMLSVFHEVLQRGITDAATPILKLPLFNDTVLSLMSQFKMQKSNYPRHSSIVDVFRQQVATNAGRVAVVDSEHRLTYSQLEKQSNADMLSAGQLVKGAVLNGYGPTENTVFSTIHPLSPEDSYTNGVPIGRAITNSGAFVMDPDQRLVPVGVIGELVVTGDGLARGYINPEHANGRFISITVDGEQIRAYRTGDYARYRPIDGQLEFMGRIDRQVKIRGHRVELREIELILRAHDSVGDVAVVLTGGTHQDARIAAFITLRDDAEAQLIRDKIHDTLRLNISCENGEPFELSPVQQLYAQFEPNFTYCLDQAFLLKLRATVPVEASPCEWRVAAACYK